MPRVKVRVGEGSDYYGGKFSTRSFRFPEVLECSDRLWKEIWEKDIVSRVPKGVKLEDLRFGWGTNDKSRRVLDRLAKVQGDFSRLHYEPKG